jgi:hypothetical protein
MINPQTIAQLRGADVGEVRKQVRGMLLATPSFAALDPLQRKDLAHSMVQVLSFLSDPTAGKPSLRGAVARSMDATDALKDRLAQRPGQVGAEFKGGATKQAGEAFKALSSAVDFPKFVSSLIEGVFTSIVNSSIRQMHEFGKFLNSVVMSLKEFANENVNLDEARDYLAGKFPAALETEEAEGGKRLRRKDDVEDAAFPSFKEMFGLGEEPDLDDEEGEKQIVESAQLQLARMRQQQLATMVMLGINRIVVTEGEIKASVVFDVQASDDASREATAASSDTQSHSDYRSKQQYQRNRSFWGTQRSGSSEYEQQVNTRIQSATSGITDKSDSHLEAKAKLTGFVQVKFKSETFPLERMANPMEMAAVQERAAR